MSKFNKTGRKALSVFMSVATVTWLVGAPLAASAALTQSNIDSIIGLLQSFGADSATINNVRTSLSGGAPSGGTGSGTSTGSCGFTRDLQVGVTAGEDVRCLQKYLNGAGHQVSATGAGSPGNESTSFGPLTKAAVMKWQAANSITPAAGYFGAKSRAAYNAMAGGTTPPPSGTPPPAGTGTGLSVSAGTQPQATLAVQGAINVPFTRVRFTASNDGDVVVNSLTVERTGLMNDAVFSGIIILDETGNRVGLSKTPNSNHQAILTEPFTVKAGQTREMTLAGDMATSLSSYAGQAGTLTLVAVNTSAIVNGSLPITGTVQTINSSLTVGTVTLDNGSLEPGSSVTKEVGTTGYTFASIKATAGSAEDIEWRSIRFNQAGSAATADIGNLKVVDKSGNVHTPVVSSDGKYYTANFNPVILIKKGESSEVSIKGDVVSGSNRTINFDIYRTSDVVFRGKTFGYDVAPTADDGTQTTATDDAFFDDDANPFYDGRLVTIGAGSLRADKSNTVAAGFVAQGATGAAIGAFEFEAKGEPVEFTSWVLTIATTDSDSGGEGAALTNVTIYGPGGNAVAGPKDFVKTSITFTDTVTVPVGKNVYTVKGNLATTGWENNDTIQVSFTPSSSLTSVKGSNTQNSLTPSPASSVSANAQTVKAAASIVTPSSSFVATNIVVNSTNVELGRITFDAAASGDDLRITTIKANLETSSTMDVDDLNGLSLWDGTTELTTGSNKQNPSGSTAGDDIAITWTLDNPLIVTKGGSKNIAVKANVSSSVTADETVKVNFNAPTTGSIADGDWTVTGVATGAEITEDLDTTTEGGLVTFKALGSYTVTVDSSAPTEKWVAAGSTDVVLNVLRFTGTTEAQAITDLRLQLDTTGSSTGADYKRVGLYIGSTKIAEKNDPSFTNNVEDFTFNSGSSCYSGSGTITPALGCLVVPKDSFVLVTIKADLPLVENGSGGSAGEVIGVGYDGATSNKNKGIGYGSGVVVNGSTDADRPTASDTSTQLVYFKSVPTVTALALTNTTLVGAKKTLYRFTVKADAKGDVALNRVTFRISTTAGANFSTTANFRVLDTVTGKYLNNATGTTAGFFSGASSAGALKNFDANDQLILRIFVNNTTDYSSGYVTIAANETREFQLEGVPTTDGTGDSISVQMLGDSARPEGLSLTGSSAILMGKVSIIDNDQRGVAGWGVGASAASSTNFIWSDFSSDATTTHSTATADWMNGFRIIPNDLSPSSLSN